MAENEPVKPAGPIQTAEEVPPEAIATPPTFIPERETPEAKKIREAEGLPEPPPLKMPQHGKGPGPAPPRDTAPTEPPKGARR